MTRSRTLRTLGVVTAAYERMSALSGHRRPATIPVTRQLPVVVSAVDVVADDVVALRLESPDGAPVPPWHPGAHLDVELPGGLLRQYSLCGDPLERDHYRIAVRRLAGGGGGSIAMHRLRPGDRLTVRGPRNAFPYIARNCYLFVAGGIGITPILPMVRDAHRRGTDWRLVYTGRSRATMPFTDELLALDADRVELRPDDERGVPDAAEILAQAPIGAALYTCGPPAMIAALRTAMPPSLVATLHSERFWAPPVVGGEPFEIELARTGTVLPVAADESVLTALRRVRPDVAYSCRQGFCGTCPVAVLAGEVEHRDRCLTPVERLTSMATCVSRASGRVVLDL